MNETDLEEEKKYISYIYSYEALSGESHTYYYMLYIM